MRSNICTRARLSGRDSGQSHDALNPSSRESHRSALLTSSAPSGHLSRLMEDGAVAAGDAQSATSAMAAGGRTTTDGFNSTRGSCGQWRRPNCRGPAGCGDSRSRARWSAASAPAAGGSPAFGHSSKPMGVRVVAAAASCTLRRRMRLSASGTVLTGGRPASASSGGRYGTCRSSCPSMEPCASWKATGAHSRVSTTGVNWECCSCSKGRRSE